MAPARRSFAWRLGAILALGGFAGVLIALLSPGGDEFDMSSFRQVLSALGQHGPLGVYDALPHVGDVRWPYPPVYFPWVYASGVLASHGGPSLELTIRLAPIAANLGIAFVVQDFLGRRGAERSTRLAGAALVAPGPSFLVVSGYHGQFDAVAFLPAVLALTLWERDLPRRALWAGLLIGLGGALKTVPLLLLVALLPSVRTRREAAVLVGAAALPVLAALAPFAIAGTLPDSRVRSRRRVCSRHARRSAPQAAAGRRAASSSA